MAVRAYPKTGRNLRELLLRLINPLNGGGIPHALHSVRWAADVAAGARPLIGPGER